MPYTIYDAIKDEIDFLETLEKVEETEKHTFAAAIIAHQKSSLHRILRRFDGGYEFDIVRNKIDGKPSITFKKTDRKTLEEEYPALKKAAEQYDIVKNLVDSTPDE
jgi:hypothetical protein